MTTRVLIAAGLVAALAGGTAVAMDQPQGPGRRGPGPRGAFGAGGMDLGLRGIDLTDEQRQQVRSVMESHQAELQQLAATMREAHRALAEAANAESLDEAAIRARSAAVAGALADEAILRAKIRAHFFALLTPEQQQQMKERKRR